MSLDDPHAHPKNEDAVRAAPPELPAQDLKQYKQSVMSLLRPGETTLAALRWDFFPWQTCFSNTCCCSALLYNTVAVDMG